MELTIPQQIFDQLNKANRVLIALPESLHADSVASGLALARFLKRLDKEADVASSGNLPSELRFLPGADSVRQSLSSGKSLVVVVDTSVKELDEISYQTTDDKVSIYLKPKDGSFAPEDISFSQDKLPYDVVVTLDAVSLEDLGTLFEQNADVFFEVPKINIDNHPSNEYFAPINLVDISATSIAEILTTLLTAYEDQMVDEDIATCLLAGLVAKTNSFQHVQTTPKAFLKASELINLGARQQEVVKYLYKTKSLPFLRLWGRVLARLKIDDSLSAAYSLLSQADFGKSGATDADLRAALTELLNNISGYKLAAIISELGEGGVRILAAGHPQFNIDQFVTLAGDGAKLESAPVGTYRVADVKLPGITLAEAETRLLDIVRSVQAKPAATLAEERP